MINSIKKSKRARLYPVYGKRVEIKKEKARQKEIRL